MKEELWWVYIIEATNGNLYTGITNHLLRRFKQHQNGSGAKFFRFTQPKHVLYFEILPSKSEALKKEFQIKQLSKLNKMKLIQTSLTVGIFKLF
jgi:putative endonuclease